MLREYAELVTGVGALACLKGQRGKPGTRWHTTTPSRLTAFPSDIGVSDGFLKLTLDMRRAKATDVDHERSVERFGDRIRVAHLYDSDGTGDTHESLPSFQSVAMDIGAPYNTLEMRSHVGVERCVSGTDA